MKNLFNKHTKWKSTLMASDKTIKDAIINLNKSHLKIVLIVDSKTNSFQGIVSDGDNVHLYPCLLNSGKERHQMFKMKIIGKYSAKEPDEIKDTPWFPRQSSEDGFQDFTSCRIDDPESVSDTKLQTIKDIVVSKNMTALDEWFSAANRFHRLDMKRETYGGDQHFVQHYINYIRDYRLMSPNVTFAGEELLTGISGRRAQVNAERLASCVADMEAHSYFRYHVRTMCHAPHRRGGRVRRLALAGGGGGGGGRWQRSSRSLQQQSL